MQAEHTYLDYNASAPLRPQARLAMTALWDEVGNPSSVHWHGRAMHRHVEDARDALATLIGATSSGVAFTAGGTEANNLALTLGHERTLIVSAIEHDSTLQAARAHGATLCPATEAGLVDLEALSSLLRRRGARAVVSIMAVNNETGVIQPVAEAGALCREHGALLHCDAVQALGRMPLDMNAMQIDILSLSAHKVGGPQGVGALVLRDGLAPPPPLLLGGGQERGRRPGTHNVAGIVGFVTAAVAAVEESDAYERLAGWRDAMEARAADDADIRIIGGGARRVGGVSCLALPGLSAETQVMMLDLAGFSISAGSACSSGKVAPSHVLRAMGLGDDLAGCAIRVSGGWSSTEQDFLRFAEAYQGMVTRVSRAA